MSEIMIHRLINNKLITRITAIALVSAMAFALSPAMVSASITLLTKQTGNSAQTTIDGNIEVVFQTLGKTEIVPHNTVANAHYELFIKVPQTNGKGKQAKYKSMSYEKAVVKKQGDVTIRIEKWNRFAQEPIPSSEFAGYGNTWINVSATTNEDERFPPIEARPYTIILQLTGVKGILQDGTAVVLDDYDVLFPQSFRFLHMRDIPMDVFMPEQSYVIGNGIVPHQKKLGIENVEGSGIDLDPALEEPVIIKIPAGMGSFHVNDAGFNIQLPPDFFGPGSEPFEGTVVCPGEDSDTTDTIIKRGEIDLPPEGTDTVLIEIVELQLVSCQPIVVTDKDGNRQEWNVKVNLPPTPQPQGRMTVTRTHEDGGTFDAELPVAPMFTFTQVSEDDTTNPLHLLGDANDYRAMNIPWQICPGTESDFCPDEIPFQADNSWLFLQVQPPLQQAPPDCGRLTCETQPN